MDCVVNLCYHVGYQIVICYNCKALEIRYRPPCISRFLYPMINDHSGMFSKALLSREFVKDNFLIACVIIEMI